MVASKDYSVTGSDATSTSSLPSLIVDAVQAAKVAGLRYATDTVPGLRRSRDDDSQPFRYFRPDGREIDDPPELERIQKLGIPPAWSDVWISPLANSHLQATGRDARGRKQYRYHTRWRATRDETKFGRMVSFGEALPDIRQRAIRDLSLPGMPREKVLATAVMLLDLTHVRVGNEEYARENETFGLTTLRGEHVAVSGTTIRFRFRGKSGKEHEISVRDRRLAKIIKRCQDLPGHELFQYTDDSGQVRSIDSGDVNQYLRDIVGQDFTAKDFRTWAGTLVAACSLREVGPYSSETQAKQNIVHAIKTAAAHLGNTPAICRKCYVHPGVLDFYMNRSILEPEPPACVEATSLSDRMREDEAWTLDLLRRITASSTTLIGAA